MQVSGGASPKNRQVPFPRPKSLVILCKIPGMALPKITKSPFLLIGEQGDSMTDSGDGSPKNHQVAYSKSKMILCKILEMSLPKIAKSLLRFQGTRLLCAGLRRWLSQKSQNPFFQGQDDSVQGSRRLSQKSLSALSFLFQGAR